MNESNFEYNLKVRDVEITLDPLSNFFIKLDQNNLIEYADLDFCNVIGYYEHELIGESFHKILHPTMPRVFFDMLYENPLNREKFLMVIKLLAKDGRFFWVLSEYITKTNNFGEIINQYNRSTAVSSYVVQQIEPLYKILSRIEAKTDNTVVSRRYITGFLEEQITTYHDFAHKLFSNIPNTIRDQDFFGNNTTSLKIFNNREAHFNQNNFNPFLENPKKEAEEVQPPPKRGFLSFLFNSKE